jgi:hypothetical protein
MNIKERIKNIKEYFKEMQIVTIEDEQIIYVVVKFPHGWVIDSDVETKYNVTVEEGNAPNEYYFSTDIESGENVIFDAIEYNVEKMKDAIERAQLLKQKMIELKNIFENDEITLDELRHLKFSYKIHPLSGTEAPISNTLVVTAEPTITVKENKIKKGSNGKIETDSTQIEKDNKDLTKI